MTDPIAFFVPGRPFSKRRPRAGNGRVYTHAETVAAEKAVRWYAKIARGERQPQAGPLRVEMEFRFAVPASWSVAKKVDAWWHVFKPDLDNLEKLVLDALNPNEKAQWTGLWLDDGQVCSVVKTKVYTLDEAREGTVVTVTPL